VNVTTVPLLKPPAGTVQVIVPSFVANALKSLNPLSVIFTSVPAEIEVNRRIANLSGSSQQ